MMTKVLLTFIATIILYYTYKLLFGKCNRFEICRIILLTMSLFAFVFPFITIEISEPLPEYFLTLDDIEILSDDIAIVETDNVKNNSLSFLQIISVIYISGVIFSFMKIIFNIHKIHKMKIGKKQEIVDGFNIIYMSENHIPFSFFNNIFIPDDKNPLILKHEMSHVKHRHSLDIILMEIMISFQWFNPFMKLMKRELQGVHEYIADNETIENETDKSNYMMLLLQQCTADDFNTLANNFSFLLTKKRIIMITQKQKSKRMVIRMLLTLPVFAFLTLLNTQCENPKPQNQVQGVDVSTEYDVESDGDKTITKESVTVTVTGNFPNDTIYNVAEEMPQFPGGANELMKYLSKNIKYPQKAVENNIEGRVFVSFVIEKDGTVTNAEVMRGFDKDCDAEALRVVSSMPRWSPGLNEEGTPVRCKFTVPVVFKLNAEK